MSTRPRLLPLALDPHHGPQCAGSFYWVVARKAVAEGEDPDAFWIRVGSAWPHKDGKGLNLVLSALPINGRLVLREYTPEDEKKDDEKKVAKFRKK